MSRRSPDNLGQNDQLPSPESSEGSTLRQRILQRQAPPSPLGSPQSQDPVFYQPSPDRKSPSELYVWIIETVRNVVAFVAANGGRDLMIWAKRLSIKYLPKLLLFFLALPMAIKLIMQPTCQLPLIAKHIPYCLQNPSGADFAPDFPRIVSLQKGLVGAMDESASGSIVGVRLKNSELVIQDLMVQAAHSAMAEKDTLVKHLEKFVTAAKATGRNLQKFSSRVGGTVDEIVTLNEHVLHLLERTSNDMQLQKGSWRIQRVFNSLNPAKTITPETMAARRKEVKTLWYDMTHLMKVNLERLIFEAERNTRALDGLEGQLNLVNGIIARENIRITADETEISNQFWTRFGRNNGKLHDLKSRGDLLKEMRNYREKASSHVAHTLLELQQMLADLEDLDEHVSRPSLLGKKSEIPIEVQIGTLKKGTERLLEAQKLARGREHKYLRENI